MRWTAAMETPAGVIGGFDAGRDAREFPPEQAAASTTSGSPAAATAIPPRPRLIIRTTVGRRPTEKVVSRCTFSPSLWVNQPPPDTPAKQIPSSLQHMGETVDQVTGSLRSLAVELVRSGRTSEAAAVLAGIGAVEMLSMFSEAAKPAQNGHQAQSEHQHEPFG
jgi:hypothetical protein